MKIFFGRIARVGSGCSGPWNMGRGGEDRPARLWVQCMPSAPDGKRKRQIFETLTYNVGVTSGAGIVVSVLISTAFSAAALRLRVSFAFLAASLRFFAAAFRLRVSLAFFAASLRLFAAALAFFVTAALCPAV